VLCGGRLDHSESARLHGVSVLEGVARRDSKWDEV
jgi:hypothetical protein